MRFSEVIQAYGFDCRARKLSDKTIGNDQKQLRYFHRYPEAEYRVFEVEEAAKAIQNRHTVIDRCACCSFHDHALQRKLEQPQGFQNHHDEHDDQQASNNPDDHIQLFYVQLHLAVPLFLLGLNSHGKWAQIPLALFQLLFFFQELFFTLFQLVLCHGITSWQCTCGCPAQRPAR